MYTLNRLLPYVVGLFLLCPMLTSCLDDEGFVDGFFTGTIQETENLPEIENADAILMAIRRVARVEQSGYDVVKTIGEASAMFFDENNYPSLTTAGDVKVNGQFLFLKQNRQYSFSVDLTNEAGQVFNSIIDWEVSGDNSFPALYKKMKMWPSVGPVSSSKVIQIGADYELSIDYLNNANATSFQIAGVGALLKEYRSDAMLSHTFTTEEIATLGRGPGIVQVNAYHISDSLANGKLIYFINAEASYEVITIR